MADYIDSEAEESEEEEELRPSEKKKLKKLKRHVEDDEEEEEDDDERIAEEMKDLIDDNEEEEEESDSDSFVGKRKRAEEDDDLDDRLEEDDYDLIEENLGVKVQRKKFRRVQQIEDDESDEEENHDQSQGHAREAIANELFDGDDQDGEAVGAHRQEEQYQGEHYSEEEVDYSDTDDFIVDDDGQPLTKRRQRRIKYTDAALQQAQDIFGVDFDFKEFDAYGEEYDEEVEDLDYEEEEVEDEMRRRPKKQVRKKHTRKSIFEVYEPSELERGHFTEKDNEIRAADIPERFQLRGVPVTTAEDPELEEEAEWIYKFAFCTSTISTQEIDMKFTRKEAAAVVSSLSAFDKLAVNSQSKSSDDDGDWDTEIPETGVKAETSTGDGDGDGERWDDVIDTKSSIKKKSSKDDNDDWDAGIDEIDKKESSSPQHPSDDHETGKDESETWDEVMPEASDDTRKKASDGEDDWNAEIPGASATGKSATTSPTKKQPTNWEEDKKKINSINKIKEALNFMRNQHLEVPFIAFYRKEYVEPELNIDDLWKIYSWDEKWCQLRTRKLGLLRLFDKMQSYQCDEIVSARDQPLSDDARILSDEDLERVKGIQSFEELRDVYIHFMLYYGQDVPKMQEMYARKKQIEKRQTILDENNEEVEVQEEEAPTETKIKKAKKSDGYTLCRNAGLAGMVKKFGLTAAQFGENLRDNYQRNEVEQYPMDPLEAAQEHICKAFPTADAVLEGARYMLATQLAREPLVRKVIRETYFERAKLCVKATDKGIKEIDENHCCYSMKYVRNKPVKELKGEQFLKLTMAESEKLLKISISIDMQSRDGGSSSLLSYIDEIKQLFYRDEFSKNVQEWNRQRQMVLDFALTKFLYPVLQKELTLKLLQECYDCIIRLSCKKLNSWLKVGPYVPDSSMDDEEDFDASNGLRVLAIAYIPDWETAGFGVLVDIDGEMSDFIRLPHIFKRKKAFKESDRENKFSELNKLKSFISNKKPHVICVGGESREALNIIEDLKQLVSELCETDQLPLIGVELLDNELAKVFMNTSKAQNDFRDYPLLLRQAVSLGRRMQDPLYEFAQLCNADDEICCLKFHPLQDQAAKEALVNALYLEFINRTNEVGVDLNRALAQPHTASVIQFICGLGPRKGLSLLKYFKQNNSRLENRTQLVTGYRMGPKVFINCAGFIKIDTNALGDSTEAYVEVLDGSRVHPEAYEWARKMAVDALEYDDMAEDANPAGALEEILENPEKLKDLDLDAFAEELGRQNFGNKSITLYDIRAELNCRYKDNRTPFRPPTDEERFTILTKESKESLHVGKMVLAKVGGIAHRKPKGEQLDQANPVRNDETGLWQCPFCLKNDFLEVSEVWNHFDAGSCPGQAIGVRVYLDNGISGFISTKYISDKHVTNPEDRVKVGMTIHGRILKLDIERFSVDLTCRSSDLADKNSEFKPAKDTYYSQEDEDKDNKVNEDLRKRQTRQNYVKRVIVHPSFHNIAFKDAEKLLSTMDQGEVVIRPSSKGSDHLTITWKVTDGIYHHIDVREEGKENAFSLGQSLWIGDDEFEDLDEIIARHVQPMAATARDILNYKYYRDTQGGKREVIEKILVEEKKKTSSKIHYLVTANKEFPPKFLLSYLPRTKCRHEFITAVPEGLRYRQQVFQSVGSLIKWFKDHFRDPVPGTPSNHNRTPVAGGNVMATPSINIANIDPQTIQKAAQNLPRHMYNTLSQVASQTPSISSTNYANRYGSYGFHAQTPLATPMMTPSYHAIATPSHIMQTPAYPATPRPTWSHHAPTHSGHSSHSSQHQHQHHSSGHRTPSSRPSSSTQNPSVRASTSETDWKKAAELWAAKARQTGKPENTPRATPRASPAVRTGNTPRVDSTPAGDATPLIDEH
ncbi:hypothetical protein CHUAL_012908 [Chamberlinius hualienensis]